MLNPTALHPNAARHQAAAALPVLQLVMKRWCNASLHRALSAWWLASTADSLAERARCEQLGAWWKSVMKIGGMNDSRMRGCVVQRWRSVEVSTSLGWWRHNTVTHQMRQLLQQDQLAELTYQLQRAVDVLHRSQTDGTEAVDKESRRAFL